MTLHKTAADIRAEQLAGRLNANLVGTGICVVAGRRGDFSVSIHRLKKDEVEPLVMRLMDYAGREPGEV